MPILWSEEYLTDVRIIPILTQRDIGVDRTLALPSFSRQAKASELSLVFWLNENVPLQTVIVAHIQVYHPFPASLLHYVRRHPLSVSPE